VFRNVIGITWIFPGIIGDKKQKFGCVVWQKDLGQLYFGKSGMWNGIPS
jgi:hypothetical protein